MSQPELFKEPREGEVVLTCPHDYQWKAKAIYIGHLSGGKPSGLGALVKLADGKQWFIRWVVLCWWCRVWRWLRRQPALKRAKREMMWGEK